ncbi:hypothetical protein AA313_de0208250 [Arthrobotrys entomopaga]|nr:hypothetical protein AA313_de0208250 [Arthrobotrys entomopaga]
MCTDIDVFYACGHRGHPAREDGPDAEEIYRGCTTETPTARCVRSCPSFAKTGKVCPPSERLVITQVFDITCFDKQCDRIAAQKFDDERCALMLDKMERDTAEGKKFVEGLSEKEKSEMAKAGAKISQPPVWGRKGPHVKKPRKVKTKEERQKERLERELAAGIVSAATIEAAANRPPKRSRLRNKVAESSQIEGAEVKVIENQKGKKRKMQDDVQEKEPDPKLKTVRGGPGRPRKEKPIITSEAPAENQTVDPGSVSD